MGTNSRYEVEGRLAEVIAALTVMAADHSSEASISSWVYRLARPDGKGMATATKHWLNVFNEHPEFFLVYEWQRQTKVSLRLRYANKTIDRATGKEHASLATLTSKERGDLTSLPLDADATSTLINTAISLHQATLARKADARFYWQLFAPAGLALIGVLIGIAPTIMKHPDKEPLKVTIEGVQGAKPVLIGTAKQ